MALLTSQPRYTTYYLVDISPLILCVCHNHLKPDYLLGIKAGPTPADEFASFLHLCQAGLVVACVLGLVACLALAYLCLVK